MPLYTIIYAIIMILIGLVSKFLSSSDSITILLPAFFGIAFLIFGALGYIPKWRKHVMHLSSGLALLVILGTCIPLIMRFEKATVLARTSQIAVIILTTVYLVFCVKSFIAARRAEKIPSVE